MCRLAAAVSRPSRPAHLYLFAQQAIAAEDVPLAHRQTRLLAQSILDADPTEIRQRVAKQEIHEIIDNVAQTSEK